MSPEAATVCPVESGDIVGGKYRVDRIIGVGGMGVVVAATHIELRTSVALKFLLPDRDPGLGPTERFFREARAVARLKSEHVARVFDVGRHRTAPYMMMELLDGKDLGAVLEQRTSLPVPTAVEYAIQICDGLTDAHGSGVVHRDLKPQNIFVTTRYDGKPLIKLLDFGIAKTFGNAAIGHPDLTHAAVVMGSPLYMPPEQVRSAREADIRSDLWALGVILYEAISGRRPFAGETVMEVFYNVLHEQPVPLRDAKPGVDPKLSAIVMKCLEKDPALRFQSAAHLASALERFRNADGAKKPNDETEELTVWTEPTNPRRQTVVMPGRPRRPARNGRRIVAACALALGLAVTAKMAPKVRHRAETIAAMPPPAMPIPTAAVSALPDAGPPIP